MPDRQPPGDIRSTTPPNPLPFLLALGGFVLVVVVVYLFVWEDDRGRLVAPDRIDVVAEDVVRLDVLGPFEEGIATVTQVGYALGEDEIFVEVVVDEGSCAGGAACAASDEQLTAELVLPEPVDGRDVRAGTGRALADCDDAGSGFRCVADR